MGVHSGMAGLLHLLLHALMVTLSGSQEGEPVQAALCAAWHEVRVGCCSYCQHMDWGPPRASSCCCCLPHALCCSWCCCWCVVWVAGAGLPGTLLWGIVRTGGPG